MALKKVISIPAKVMLVTEGRYTKITSETRNVELTAYIKVKTVSGDKGAATASLTYSEMNTGEYLWDGAVTFPVDLAGPNYIKQGYEYLKTLDEFSGAEDC